MGDMKGVLDSEAEPNVAARDMSDPPLGCCCLPLPGQENIPMKNFLFFKCYFVFVLQFMLQVLTGEKFRIAHKQ